MPTRKSGQASRLRADVQRRTSQRAPEPGSWSSFSEAGLRWWGVASGLLGMLLVWSLLQPVDATSVFQGTAIPQNFGWLLLASLTVVACLACGMRFEFSTRCWFLAMAGLAWLLIATTLAGRENNPRVAWNGFWQVVALAACYYSASAMLPGPRSRQAALYILLVGCVALATQGLVQVFVEIPASRALYLADPEAFLSQNPDLDLPAGSPMRRRFEDRLLYSSEPYATFALTNSLAVLLSGCLVVLGGIGIAGWRIQGDSKANLSAGPTSETQHTDRSSLSDLAPSGWKGWLTLAAFWLVVLLVSVCWFLTRSRIAYVALGVGALAWFFSAGNRLRRNGGLMKGLLIVGGSAVVLGGWWLWRYDRLVLSEGLKSLSYRMEYWTATIAMLGDHGFWGVGLGNFQSYYPLYKLPAASEVIADPHNWLLDVCVSLSLPVGILLSGWLGLRVLAWGRDIEDLDVLSRLPAVNVLDAWSERCLIWGAAGGGAICLGLLGLLSGQEVPKLAVFWLGAAALIFWLRPLLRVDRASLRGTLRAAVLTMLTCLLASGSWQASGLAVPLLIGLVVLGERGARPVPFSSETVSADCEIKSESDYSTKPTNRVGQMALVGLPVLGLICFLVQCWRPTTTSWSLMQQADVASSPRVQLALVEAAAQADWLDSEPLRWRAQMVGQVALASSDQFVPLAEQTLAAFDAWLARDSTKYLNWELAGNHALELAGKAQRLRLEPQKWLEAALGYYAQGVARYPSSIGLRAQLAATLAMAERWREAKQQWTVAVQLDQETFHSDRKLASQQLWLPILPSGAAAEFADQQPWVKAEPMIDWLRKHSPEESPTGW